MTKSNSAFSQPYFWHLIKSVSHSSLKSSMGLALYSIGHASMYLVKIRYSEEATFSQEVAFSVFWHISIVHTVKKLAFSEYLNWCRFSLEFQNCPEKRRGKASWILWPNLKLHRKHFSIGVKSFWPYITYQSQWCRELGIHSKVFMARNCVAMCKFRRLQSSRHNS